MAFRTNIRKNTVYRPFHILVTDNRQITFSPAARFAGLGVILQKQARFRLIIPSGNQKALLVLPCLSRKHAVTPGKAGGGGSFHLFGALRSVPLVLV